MLRNAGIVKNIAVGVIVDANAILGGYTVLPDRGPLNIAMTEHIHFSREASNG